MNIPKKIVHSGIFLPLFLTGLLAAAQALYAADYDPLLTELKEEDWQTRFFTASEITNLNDESIYNALVSLVGNTAIDWRLRIRGIRILSKTSNPRSADVLTEIFYNSFLNNECPAIKTNLALALGNFPDDTRVVDALISGINDRELQVREASILSLGSPGNSRAVPYLLDIFSDNNFTIRVNVIRSLAKIGDRRAVPFLEAVVDNVGDPIIKNEASLALTRLK